MSINAVSTNSLTSPYANTAPLAKRDVAQEILRAVEELQQGSGFGSIEIVLHEGRVTQIEKREKFRINQQATESTHKENSKLNPTAKTAGK